MRRPERYFLSLARISAYPEYRQVLANGLFGSMFRNVGDKAGTYWGGYPGLGRGDEPPAYPTVVR